jgi:hypothetical protein
MLWKIIKRQWRTWQIQDHSDRLSQTLPVIDRLGRTKIMENIVSAPIFWPSWPLLSSYSLIHNSLLHVPYFKQRWLILSILVVEKVKLLVTHFNSKIKIMNWMSQWTLLIHMEAQASLLIWLQGNVTCLMPENVEKSRLSRIAYKWEP